VALLESGARVEQETRLFDAAHGETAPLRSKEEATTTATSRADLPPLTIDAAWLEEVRRTLPELPAARRRRLLTEYDLPEYDAEC